MTFTGEGTVNSITLERERYRVEIGVGKWPLVTHIYHYSDGHPNGLQVGDKVAVSFATILEDK